MKYRGTLVLLAGLLCMERSALSQSFSPPMNADVQGFQFVYDADPALGGAVIWDGGAWGSDWTAPKSVEEIGTFTSDFRTFTLLPETNKYYNGTSGASFWQDGDGDGGKYLSNETYWSRNLDGTEDNISFSFSVDAFDLDSRYELTAFIKVVDISTGGGSFIEIRETITGTGTFSLQLQGAESYVAMPLHIGFQMDGINANPADDWGSATVTAAALAIPEPSSIAMIGLVGGGALFIRRRLVI